jgi:hypothetical protein
MQFEFSTMAKTARESIAVPELRMDVIRRRSHAAAAAWRVQALAACAALTVAALTIGIGFGANIYQGLHVWLSGGKAAITFSSMEIVRQPTASELRSFVSRATFPVTFPVGLPYDGGGMDFVVAPASDPSAIMMNYKSDTIALLDPAVVDGEKLLPGTPGQTVYHWTIGGELVLVTSKSISPGEADRIKAAFGGVSPVESVTAMEKLLPTVIVLGSLDVVAAPEDGTRNGRRSVPTLVASEAANILKAAERVAPAQSQSVLINPAHVRSLWQLAKDGAPLLDSRNLYADKIPTTANGRPDLTRAVWSQTKAIAVPANGVRAIVAVLRSSDEKEGAPCDCVLLFNQPSAGTYRIWKISPAAVPDVTSYTVDAATLAVKRSP